MNLRKFAIAIPVATLLVSGCSSSEGVQDHLAGTENGSFSLRYHSSAVEATADGAEVSLAPFSFSSGAKIRDAAIVDAGSGCVGTVNKIAGKVVIAERGGCSFKKKYDSLSQANPAAIVIIDPSTRSSSRETWQVEPTATLTNVPILRTNDGQSSANLRSSRHLSIEFDATIARTPRG